MIGGVDLAEDLDDAAVAEIRRAILDHGVVFFRGPVAHARRSRSRSAAGSVPYSPVPFVQPIAEHDEVIAVVREPTERQGFAFGGIWHSDFSILPEPPMGSILHALEVPPYGGDTLWANQYLAFETLSPGLQQTLRGLTGVHSARDAYSPKMQAIHDQFEGMTRADERDREPDAVASRGPRARRDRTRGAVPEPAVHDRARRLVAARGEGAARRPLPPRDASRVHVPVAVGSAGDVAFWDNRCVQHMVMADVEGHRRAMHRTTVAGEAPA